jgi:hypothetical protein
MLNTVAPKDVEKMRAEFEKAVRDECAPMDTDALFVRDEGRDEYFTEWVQDRWWGYQMCALHLQEQRRELEEALRRVAEWRLPATGRFWDTTRKDPMSYGSCYGTNGERDFMREVASAALESRLPRRLPWDLTPDPYGLEAAALSTPTESVEEVRKDV